MTELIEAIRAAVATSAAPEQKALGTQACRTILAALGAEAGRPLTLPGAPQRHPLAGITANQALALLIARLTADAEARDAADAAAANSVGAAGSPPPPRSVDHRSTSSNGDDDEPFGFFPAADGAGGGRCVCAGQPDPPSQVTRCARGSRTRRACRARTSATPASGAAVRHPSGITSRYIHLSRTLVVVGQTVERGERIGLSGDTATRGLPHLHLDLRAPVATLPAVEAAIGRPRSGWEPEMQPFGHSIPGEPIIPVDGYRDSVRTDAAAMGGPLRDPSLPRNYAFSILGNHRSV